MSLERAKELIESIEDLPTLPEVVIGITQLVDDPDATAEDIYKIVSTDPSLSATMLKLVNSAFYGMSRSVTSLEQAIRILGFVTVRDIALAAFVFDAFVTGKGQFDYKGFWLHSIGAAVAAKVLAARKKVKETGVCFVYGLLHDLGIIVMMQYLSDELLHIRELVEGGANFNQAEKEVLGCGHNELGAALADKWDFPPSLVGVIHRHCFDELPQENGLEAAVVSCAGVIAQALEIGESVTPQIYPVVGEAWEAAGLEVEDLGAVMDKVLREMENTRTFVNLLYS